MQIRLRPRIKKAHRETRRRPPAGINHPFKLHLSYYGCDKIAKIVDAKGIFHPDSTLAGDLAAKRVPVVAWWCNQNELDSDEQIASGNSRDARVIETTAKAFAQFFWSHSPTLVLGIQSHGFQERAEKSALPRRRR